MDPGDGQRRLELLLARPRFISSVHTDTANTSAAELHTWSDQYYGWIPVTHTLHVVQMNCLNRSRWIVVVRLCPEWNTSMILHFMLWVGDSHQSLAFKHFTNVFLFFFQTLETKSGEFLNITLKTFTYNLRPFWTSFPKLVLKNLITATVWKHQHC